MPASTSTATGAERSARQIALSDGRLLGYAVYGEAEGRPIVYCHGFPGSRLEARLGEATARRLRARIIAPDRPGFGLSDFKPRRTIVDWPDDVEELADALGLGRFAVVGLSGGGPYALSCGWKIPHRLTLAGVVCGIGPLDLPGASKQMAWVPRLGMALARRTPWLELQVCKLLIEGPIRRDPQRVLSLMSAKLPEADMKAIAQPGVGELLARSFRESIRNGARGIAWDMVLYSRPWGFKLQDVSANVLLWHGEADTIVPVSHGRYQAESIANCRASFLPGEGHVSLPVAHLEEILSAMLEC